MLVRKGTSGKPYLNISIKVYLCNKLISNVSFLYLSRARYENLDNNNSEELPASLVMRLKKPFVISAQNLSEIHAVIFQSCK